MGQRSRKRRREGEPVRDRSAMSRGYARGEERNEAVRQSLEPLEPGERPRAVTIAAIVAALLAAANVILMLAGVEVNGEKPAVGGTILFAVLMLVAAYGMWRARYWAVMGFQALLAITIVIAGLSLTVASNAAAVALCAAIVGFGGWLFWKLIRAMARLQMPDRRSQTSDV
jgi:hypothetical protein